MSLEARIARLEATEAVRRTFNRYLWFLDGGKFDDLLAVFAVDATMEAMNYPPGTGGTLRFDGRDAIAEIYRPLRAGGFRHNSTNTSIAVADDALGASLTSYFLTAGPNAIQGGVYEGTLVRARAVLGAGTILTRSTPVYDIVRGEVYRATVETPLEIPENAVVVPGSRAIARGKAAEWNLSLYTPVIVKYRDEKTDKALELEELLR